MKSSAVAFIDIVLNALMGMVMLYMITIMIIGDKESPTDGVIKPKAEYLITMNWKDTSRSDVDIWMSLPTKELLNFLDQSAAGGLVTLERDDMGVEVVLDDEGHLRETLNINEETVTIRKGIDGEYTVNAFTFTFSENDELDVTLKIVQIDPYVVVYNETIAFDRTNQEKTFLTFSIENGKITILDSMPKKIVVRKQREQ